MRNKYTAMLKDLNLAIIDMASTCEMAISQSCRALSTGNRDLAHKVYISDDIVDKKEREIENMCLSLILHQQPVASDLHAISAALKMITDLERIGDQACDIAQILLKSKSDCIDHLHEIEAMGSAAVIMVHKAVEAYVQKNSDLAHSVLKLDDEIDTMFLNIKHELIEQIILNTPPAGSGRAESLCILDVLMVAKYLERIGDHACNVANWVIFAITGRHTETLIDKKATSLVNINNDVC